MAYKVIDSLITLVNYVYDVLNFVLILITDSNTFELIIYF